MNATDWIKKFSTKKDALLAIDFALKFCSEQHANDLRDVFREIDLYQDKDLATEVIKLFNEVNGTAYSNTEKIKAIIRNQPKVTIDQFASIIYHKKETWGNDPKMSQYLRPATLFGSVIKFKTYLEDATNYWIQKAKHER